jgi:hypothetical protein
MNRPLLELGFGFLAFVPNGKSENPITKDSADGAGVQPNTRSEAGEALKIAYRAALAGLPADGPETERARAMADPTPRSWAADGRRALGPLGRPSATSASQDGVGPRRDGPAYSALERADTAPAPV